MDYRDTLNLPQTKFPMKANLTSLEPMILKIWQDLQIYHLIQKSRNQRKKFILHDGPPYANGFIHIGHALNKILKDIVIKFKMLEGFQTPFICGWDCHGLPVEHQLLKELNLTKHDVDHLDFRRKAREFALKFVDIQKKDFIRLGVFSDWDNPYLTLDYQYEKAVLMLLSFLVKQGYVYRGLKPVNWCCQCETALAEAEVEYRDKESPSIYVLFKVVNSRDISLPTDTYFLIWTTTPWTLVSNVAVAVNPDFSYILVEYENKYIILAENTFTRLKEKLGLKDTVVKRFCGESLERLELQHPFFERKSEVILGDFVSGDEGSGCVHIAPGHGEEDFNVGKKYNLPIIMPVDDKGIFYGEEAGFVKGENIHSANQKIVDILSEKKLLVKEEKIHHSYPHCWRCKNPVIFRTTRQWFLNVEHNNLRKRLIEETERVVWIPPSGKERMKAMLSQRPDWCLSRQRLWGVPIPALRCTSCGEEMLISEVIENVANIVGEFGSDIWFKESIDKFLPSGVKCVYCGADKFEKNSDILDVWFESGASFMAVLLNRSELQFPADIYLEGSDQHRGWFQVSLIPSLCKNNVSPFKSILTHGFVVDGEGKKMSKSLGNVISPQEIIRKYGAEILRLWVAYSDYSEDIRLSEEIIKRIVDIYRKIRNTIRFLLSNLYDFKIKEALFSEQLHPLDRYMLMKSKKVFESGINYYRNYQFYRVLQTMFNFCNIDLSNFYLDILKERLYTYRADSQERKSAQTVLFYILRQLLKILSPILSFTCEEAYSYFDSIEDKKESIFMEFFDSNYSDYDVEYMQEWERLLTIREEVLKKIEILREQGVVGSSLEVKVTISKGDYADVCDKYREILREIFIVSAVVLRDGEFNVEVNKMEGEKCQRCWIRGGSVGKDKDFPYLCERCKTVLVGLNKEEEEDEKKSIE